MNIGEAIQLAFQHCQSGNLSQAVYLFNKILKYQPENADIMHILGTIHNQMHKHDLAIEYLNRAITLKNNPDTYFQLAIALQQKGNYEEASFCYAKAMNNNPDDFEIKNKKIDILITGTGRCGTGYMAKLLTSAGLPCGHEEIFSFTINKDRLIHNEKIGESSWLAAPFLSSTYLNDTTIIHAVRHPLHTVQSLKRIKFFIAERNYCRYVEKYLPKIKTIDPDKVPFYFFIAWSKMILKYEKNARYIRHKVEDDPVSLIRKIGGDITNLFSDTKFNTKGNDKIQKEITTDEIPVEYKAEFLELSGRIGYKLC
jgi:tetratricopeptide (TPR) repeat protein